VPANILLDLDGTLTDPYPGISRCIVHAIEEQGLPAPPERQLGDWIGPPLLESFARYFESLGEGDADRALVSYRGRFTEKGLFENAVYDGIPDLLRDWQSQGKKLYLATSKPRVFAQRIVEHFGLDRFLSGVHGSELDGRRSDKVDLLEHVIRHEQLRPGECAMVGDRKHDVAAARYHGMRAVGVLWGYGSREELLAAGAERLAVDCADLSAQIGA
jgi:phosphoglycolate phosphatase